MLAKRLFDLICVIPGLIIISPVLIAIGICIRLDSPGPVFFRQTRVGKNGKLFQILKFRTMVTDAERLGLKITTGNDPRVTRCGKLLRKSKLDELAQLFNVLRGEMSLVGPRPEVPEYVEHYPEHDKNRILSVPPGITDLASIEFRSENELLATRADPHKVYIEEILPIKINYYLRYVEQRSLLGDLKIILKTLKAIVT